MHRPTLIKCSPRNVKIVRTRLTWASAHRGKWGQLTPLKMDEKLKSENMQKRAVLTAIRAGRCRERRYTDHIIYSDNTSECSIS